MKVNSIRFKIGVLFVVILGVVLVVYSTFLYMSLYITLYKELDDGLIAKAKEITRTIDMFVKRYGSGEEDITTLVKKVIVFEELPDPDDLDVLQEQWIHRVDILNLKDNYITFLDIEGNVFMHSENLKGPIFFPNADEILDLREGVPVYTSSKVQNMKVRAVSYPYLFRGERLYTVQVGASLKSIMHILRNRLIHILASIPVILLVASFFGRLFVSRLLKPVFEITRTAHKISHENLSARVSKVHADEEMKYLVDAFNEMISRLEGSFSAVSDFSAHVAHELKTPLTIIKGESDIALRREREKSEYKEAITTIREESDRMLRVIEDLLLLTRLDFPEKAFIFEQFDLVALLNDLYEQSKPLARKRKLTMSMNAAVDHIFIRGDSLHIRRLFINLIDNALKYTAANGRICIDAAIMNGKAIVTVSDTGAGITAEDLPKIFDRFYRASSIRKQGTHGIGLGLSIVKSIVDIHQGCIEVKSTLGKGSSFIVILHLSVSTELIPH
jgi:heavy metal sensor kinase